MMATTVRSGAPYLAPMAAGKAKPIVLWTLAAILLIIVFFAVRMLTREQLPLRVAQATMQDLATKDSTNGKIEPQHNFEAHAPAPGVVKHLYIKAGEAVPRGKLLLSLDDADAIAKKRGQGPRLLVRIAVTATIISSRLRTSPPRGPS